MQNTSLVHPMHHLGFLTVMEITLPNEFCQAVTDLFTHVILEEEEGFKTALLKPTLFNFYNVFQNAVSIHLGNLSSSQKAARSAVASPDSPVL